jgi:lysylphosphatidylglycerol synthetase-like protein (DUF2156 family)
MQDMKTKIRQLITAMAVLLGMALVASPAMSLAATDCDADGNGTITTQEAIQCGARAGSGTDQTSKQAESNINTTIKDLLNILTALVGVTAVIMVILAGFRYITSGGKQESVTSAKNSLLYAVIGLVIVALAQVIVRFVLNKVTKAT